MVPSSVPLADLHLAITVQSHCGPMTVPLHRVGTFVIPDRSLASQMEHEGYVRDLMSTTPGDAIRTARLLVDRDPGDVRPLRVGEALIPIGELRPKVIIGTCGTTAPVRVGDEEIGTMNLTGRATLVSVAPACHRLERIQYGGLGNFDRPIWFATRVREVESYPDYFLTSAPTTHYVDSAVGSTRVTELTRIECPAEPRPARRGGRR